MNDNTKKWVEALRSGRFKQGKFRLTTIRSNGAEFDCCLGVACKVFVEENPGLLKVEKHTVGSRIMRPSATLNTMEISFYFPCWLRTGWE